MSDPVSRWRCGTWARGWGRSRSLNPGRSAGTTRWCGTAIPCGTWPAPATPTSTGAWQSTPSKQPTRARRRGRYRRAIGWCFRGHRLREVDGEMRFTPFPKVGPDDVRVTPQRLAAAKRALQRERERAGMFVEELGPRETPEERIARQDAAWVAHWQR